MKAWTLREIVELIEAFQAERLRDAMDYFAGVDG